MKPKHGLQLAFALLLAALPLLGSAEESAPASVSSRPADTPLNDQAVVAATAPDETVCAQVVGNLHGSLLEAMQNAKSLGYQGRFDLLFPVVGETFDVEFMASKSVGRHWKSMSDEERREWVNLFWRHLTANYASRFNGHSGETFATLGEEPATRGTILVRTVLNRPDDENVELNYRMREANAGWRVIDIYLKGTVSELALRRSEYSSMIKREGFDHLVLSLEDKISSWRKEAEASS